MDWSESAVFREMRLAACVTGLLEVMPDSLARSSNHQVRGYLLSTHYAPSPGLTRRVEHVSLQQLEKSRREAQVTAGFREHKPFGELELWKGRKRGDTPGPDRRGP